MTCMHVAHAVVGPIEKQFWDGGAEGGVQIGVVGGLAGREGGGQARSRFSNDPVVEEREGAGVEVGTIVGQSRRYLSIPMGGGVGVSQQRRDLGGIFLASCAWSGLVRHLLLL